MKILIVSQHFYPESFRINDIAFSLAKRGHEVTVLTGLPNYPSGIIYPGYRHGEKRDQLINSVHIIRSSLVGRGKSLWRFGLNYLWFAIAAKNKAKKLKTKFDLVFCYQTSPVTMAWPAIEVKKRQKIPFILLCLDQWPISITAGPFRYNSLPYKFFWRLSRDTYQQADRILITSQSFKDYFETELKLDAKTYGLDYWPQYAEDDYAHTQVINNQLFDLVYAGNIGPASDCETIVKAAKLLISHKDIHFHVVGDGVNRQICEKLAEGLENITFHGFYPVNKLKAFYDLADAFLITMKDNEVVNYTLPAKMQSYMLAAKPIVGAINGETKRVIKVANCGYCSEASNAHHLAENILSLKKDTEIKQKGKNALKYYQQHFNKEKLLTQFEEICSEMIQEVEK